MPRNITVNGVVHHATQEIKYTEIRTHGSGDQKQKDETVIALYLHVHLYRIINGTSKAGKETKSPMGDNVMSAEKERFLLKIVLYMSTMINNVNYNNCCKF